MKSEDFMAHFALDHIVADDLVAIHVCHSGRDCWPAKEVAA